MKWWERFKQLQQHRWLPFYLPVIGTLLYIAIATLLVPSEFGDKLDTDATYSEKSVADGKRAPASGRMARAKRTEMAAGPKTAAPATVPSSQ